VKAESREQKTINHKQAAESAVVIRGRLTARDPAARLKSATRCFLLSAFCLLVFAAPALAQAGRPVRPSDIRFEQRLDSQVPLDLNFRDETGRTVRLGDYFNGKPVILALVYYDCPMLCNQVLNGLARSLKTLSFDAGKEFEVLVVSFNPRETPELAGAKKESYLRDYGRPGGSAGWHFMTGDPKPIGELTKSVGFRYVYDPALNQYAHASGIMVLTPQGRLSRYFYGVEYAPRDLRLGLIEASSGRIGTPVDELLLLCYQYDPATGKYSAAVLNALRVGGALTCLFIVVLLTLLGRKAKRRINSTVKPVNSRLTGIFFLLPFAPDQASTVAGSIDALYLFLVAIATFFAALIAGLEIYFAIKYRRRSPDEFPPASASSLKLELTWTVIPSLIVLVIFVWGAKLYFDIYRNPSDALDVYVTAKQWMWRFQHMDGRREINELHVPVGRRIRLIMASEDAIHSFYVPAFRVKADVVPGKNRYTTAWFEATKPGRYHLFCSEYCGTNHSGMIGWVDVMEPAEYQKWLGGGAATGSLAAGGEQLFQQQACATCHRSDNTGRGPKLEGLFGSKVVLDNGQTVIADESYLRESILNPQAKIVAGYPRPSNMPAFDTLINEEQLLQLIAYIKSIGPQNKEKQARSGPAAQPKEKGVEQ
jgi:cytochrome c oxidase subunit II